MSRCGGSSPDVRALPARAAAAWRCRSARGSNRAEVVKRRSSGSATDVVERYVIRQEEPPLFPAPAVAEVTRARRKWPFVVAGVALVLAAVLAAATGYLLTRGPDLAAFHGGLHQAAELSLSLQA